MRALQDKRNAEDVVVLVQLVLEEEGRWQQDTASGVEMGDGAFAAAVNGEWMQKVNVVVDNAAAVVAVVVVVVVVVVVDAAAAAAVVDDEADGDGGVMVVAAACCCLRLWEVRLQNSPAGSDYDSY